jgi:hypothetical protein
MFEAGDGRVTRASLLAAHLDDARRPGATSGVPEVGQVYFGGADHHGLYADPAFQSLLLRLLVAPPASPVAAATAPRDGLEERAS